MGQTDRVLDGRYVLHEILGTGGMSVVWRARDLVLDRQVAVKLLSGRYAADPLWSRRIRGEARAAAALSHPNVAQVYDFGETGPEAGGPVPFVVMELIDGHTLEDRMVAGPVPVRAALRLCAEVAAALAAAHTRGLVHRDIKPANIMITPLGAKVVDFGIAATVRPDGREPDDELFGTPTYIAPERLVSDAVEPASDVYSLGMLLYRLLAGRTPFPRAATTGILDAHLHTEPAPLPPLTDVPDQVAELCLSCLAKQPADRPAARQVAVALADAAGVRAVDDDLVHALAVSGTGEGTSTVLVPRILPARRTPSRPRRRRTIGLVAAGAAAAAVVAWPLLLDGGPERQSEAQAATRPTATETTANPAATVTVTVTGSAASTPPAPGGPANGATDGATGAQPSAAAALPPAGNVAGGTGGTGGGSTPTDPGPAAGPTSGTGSGGSSTGGSSTGGGPATSAPAQPPSTRSGTYTSEGGVVSATCTATTGRLTAWTPTKPYKLEQVSAGPATQVYAVFRHGNTLVQMTVTCPGGAPTASTSTSGK